MPDLLLLDEPHTALDRDAVDLVGHLVESIASAGRAVVVVSHDAERVRPIVSRSAELESGTFG